MDPVLAAVLAHQPIGELAEHAQAEVFQDRQHIGQRQRGVGVVQLAMQLLLTLGQRLVEAHHQRALVGQAVQMLHVHHRRVRSEALAIAGREAFREVGQHAGALPFTEAFVDQAGVVVLPGTAGLDDFLLQQRRIDVQLVLRVQAQDELHPRQHGFGEEGPELAVAGLQTLHQDLLDLHPGLGGIDITRDIGQGVGEAAIGIAAQEQADLVAFLNLHDGHRDGQEVIHRGLEQVVARQHLQYLGQVLAQVGLGVEAGAALDLGHLAADVGDANDAFGVHGRGVEAHEAALLDHLALGIQFADRHEIRVGRTVHAARLGGLGEGQQHRPAQVGQGLRLDMQVRLLQPGAAQPGNAQQGLLVVDQVTAAVLFGHGEFLIAEEGEVVVQQPLHEHLDLGQLFLVDLELGLVQPGQQFLGLGLHRLEVGDRDADVAQHFQQGLLQGLHGAIVGAAVDLQEHQRFLAHILALAALGQDFQQLALGIAAYAEHVVLQGVDAVAAAVQFHAHRVHQEGDVRVQHFNGGVGGLPAVLLVVGVEYPHFRAGGVEAFHQAPGRQGAADQVGQATLGQFVERDDAEELLGEQGYLWQRLFADVLRQGRLQLVLEVGFAGCGEGRHGCAPLGSFCWN
ncbi:hypothetical protein D9M68_298730 [compost metagenome]